MPEQLALIEELPALVQVTGTGVVTATCGHGSRYKFARQSNGVTLSASSVEGQWLGPITLPSRFGQPLTDAALIKLARKVLTDCHPGLVS